MASKDENEYDLIYSLLKYFFTRSISFTINLWIAPRSEE